MKDKPSGFKKQSDRVLEIIRSKGATTSAREINKAARLPYFILYVILDYLTHEGKIKIDSPGYEGIRLSTKPN